MSNGLALYGMGLFGEPIEPPKRGKIADEFVTPPFTVLNAREGFWQERKAAWVGMGIDGEIGRGANLINHSKTTTLGEKDTSIFDPVLTELCYRWFCPPAGLIIDPFAGGSVRGIVASCLGRRYCGIELRAEQIASNREQATEICDSGPMPEWIEGDSRNAAVLCGGLQADFIFSCPPYGNLEVYSDDPRDLSTLEYPAFAGSLAEIIKASCDLLLPDRFACFVVGNFRDKHGNYHDFAGDTIRAFSAAGLHYYNEAILVTAVGSLPIRITKQFKSGRKLGKTHQNVLVFLKGNAKRASDLCDQGSF